MKKYFISLLLLLLGFSFSMAQEEKPIKVACIGNSITFGYGIENNEQDSYPGVLQRLLGEGYEVRNFGLNGRNLIKKGDSPYMNEPTFKEALDFQPDIVTIKLGTNDSKPWNWEHQDEFKPDLEEMIDSFQALPSSPKIYLCLPIPAVGEGNFHINDSIIFHGVIPYIKEVAQERALPLIDLYTLLKPYPEYLPDRIHPNEEGSRIIADEIFRTLTGKEEK